VLVLLPLSSSSSHGLLFLVPMLLDGWLAAAALLL
jgi:hypothetical protein